MLRGRDGGFESADRRTECLEGEDDRGGEVVCFGRDMSDEDGYILREDMERKKESRSKVDGVLLKLTRSGSPVPYRYGQVTARGNPTMYMMYRSTRTRNNNSKSVKIR